MAWWILQNLVIVTALVIIVAAVCRLCRIRPAVRHALWLVVMIKLVTPPVGRWPLDVPRLWNKTRAPPPAHASAEPVPEARESQAMVGAGSAHEAAFADALHVPARQTSPVPVPVVGEPTGSPQRPRGLGLAAIGLYAWVGAALAMALLQLLRVVRFHRLVARGRPAPAWLTAQVAELAPTFRVAIPEIRVVPAIGTPLVWHVGTSKLLWPTSCTDPRRPERWRSLIAHELAHLRRHDHWVGWLELVAGCIWWWNPLFRYVRHQVRKNAEFACDAWVVSTLPELRRTYAETLIHVSQLGSQRAVPAPAAGLGASNRRTFERRLTMIMKDRSSHRVSRGGLVVTALLALIALPGLSQGISKPQPAADPVVVEPVAGPAETVGGGKPLEALPAAASASAPEPRAAVGIVGAAASREPSEKSLEVRLQAIEKQLQALLHEVQRLRAQKPTTPTIRRTRQTGEASEYGRVNTPARPRPSQSFSPFEGQSTGLAGGRNAISSASTTAPEVVQVFKVRHRPVQALCTALAALYRRDSKDTAARLIPDKRTNSLVASGPTKALERTAKLLSVLDRPARKGPSKIGAIGIYTLRYADARELANVIRELGLNVEAVAAFDSNQLIFVGEKADDTKIEALIQALDVKSESPPALYEPSAAAPPRAAHPVSRTTRPAARGTRRRPAAARPTTTGTIRSRAKRPVEPVLPTPSEGPKPPAPPPPKPVGEPVSEPTPDLVPETPAPPSTDLGTGG